MIAPSLHTRVSVFVCSSYVVVVVGLPPEELVSRGGGEVTLICILIITSQALHPNRHSPQVLSTGPKAGRCWGLRGMVDEGRDTRPACTPG